MCLSIFKPKRKLEVTVCPIKNWRFLNTAFSIPLPLKVLRQQQRRTCDWNIATKSYSTLSYLQKQSICYAPTRELKLDTRCQEAKICLMSNSQEVFLFISMVLFLELFLQNTSKILPGSLELWKIGKIFMQNNTSLSIKQTEVCQLPGAKHARTHVLYVLLLSYLDQFERNPKASLIFFFYIYDCFQFDQQ